MSSDHTLNKRPPASIFPALASVHALGAELAYPLVRLAAGAFLIPHGGQKLFGWFGADPARIAGMFEKIGFYPGTMWVTIVGLAQFCSGVLIAIGFLTRPAAVVATVVLLVAVKVTGSTGWFWNSGGAEYAVFWAIMTFAVVLQGGGRFSVDRMVCKEF